MRTELSTLDIRILIEEMQFLTGSRIDKVFDSGDSDIILQLFSKEGKKLLVISKKLFYIAAEKKETPSMPSDFCKALRKNLENRRIKEIRQHESERIIIISTDSHDLIIELFGQANVILCDKSSTIIAALRIQATGNVVKPKSRYAFPEKKLNVFNISEKQFSEVIKNSDSEVVKAVAALVGGVYAEEMCIKADVPKNRKNPDVSEIKMLYSAFSAILSRAPAPFVAYEGASIKDAFPFELEIYESSTKVAFSNFYEALDFAIRESEGTKKTTDAEKRYSKQISKIKAIIEMQKSQLETLRKEHGENKRAGELIYENYNELKELMESFEQAKKKMSISEIKAKIKNKKIVSVENSKIVVEL